jgi:hypothetical protein
MRVVVLFAAITLVVAALPPAAAGDGAGERQLAVAGRSGSPVRQQAGSGQLDPDYVRATAADFGAGTYGGGAPLAAVQPSVQPVYEWLRVPTGGDCVFVTGPLPPEVAGFVGPLPGSVGLPHQTARIAPIVDAPPGAVRYDGPDPLPESLVDIGDTASDIGLPVGWDRDIVVVPRCVQPGTALPPTADNSRHLANAARRRIRNPPRARRARRGASAVEVLADSSRRGRVRRAQPRGRRARGPGRLRAVPGDGTSAVRAGRAAPPTSSPPTISRGDYPVALYVVWLGVACGCRAWPRPRRAVAQYRHAARA